MTQHHSIEDASVLPHLRHSEPALAPVLDRLSKEHVDIHHLLSHLSYEERELLPAITRYGLAPGQL